MADNVVYLQSATMPFETIMQGALEVDIQSGIVIGRKPDGEFYMAGTITDAGEVLVLLERAKRLIMTWVE